MSDSAENQVAVKVAKIGAWQAVTVALIAALLSGIGGYNVPKAHETTSNQIRKPLEGVWNYKMTYSIFQNDNTPGWISEGEAVITWNEASKKYTMHLGAGVRNINEKTIEPVVVHFIKAFIPATETGAPNSLKVFFNYISRLGLNGFKPASGHYFTFDNIPEGKIETFSIKYESDTRTTIGNAVFTRGA